MIAVGGFNAALDRYLELDILQTGEVHRARNSHVLPGGKGLHVAAAAAALGERVRLVTCVDEANEPRFRSFLEARGVELEAIAIDGEVRTCLAIRDGSGRTTEILEPGPPVSPALANEITRRFLHAATDARIAVLSGSLPQGMASGTYATLVKLLARDSTRCIVDTSDEPLRYAAAAGPFAIAPNVREAERLTGERPLDTPAGAMAACRAWARGTNIALVVVTLGAGGAVACWHDRTCHVAAPLVAAPKNAVGAGDCLVAGLAVGLARRLPDEEVLRLGVACGTAKVLWEETGLLRHADVARLMPEVAVRWDDTRDGV